MRYILVTGASSGIGLDTALRLKESYEWHPIGTVRKEEDQVRLKDIGIDSVIMDLDEEKSVLIGFAQALRIAGTLDAIFLNAGFGLPGRVQDITRGALLAQMNTNVFGTHQLCNLFLGQVDHNNKRARIIVNSSVLGFCCIPMRSAYCSSKFALEALMTCLSLELKREHSSVKVSIIQPGPIITNFRKNALNAFHTHISSDSKKPPYKELVDRLSNPNGSRSALPASAVTNKVMHALGSKPKVVYRVNLGTHLSWYLKRLLPVRFFNFIMAKSPS